MVTRPASRPTTPNTDPPVSRSGGSGGRSGANAMRSRSSLTATSPSKLPLRFLTFHGGAGSRGRGAGGGRRGGGPTFGAGGSPPGRSPLGAGSGPATRARFGAYFNGPCDSGSRSRVLILCPSNATLYAYASTRSTRPAAGATPRFLKKKASASAVRIPARTVDAGRDQTGRGAWSMLRQPSLPTRRKHTHAADVAAAGIQP